jgi:hypothetical protein
MDIRPWVGDPQLRSIGTTGPTHRPCIPCQARTWPDCSFSPRSPEHPAKQTNHAPANRSLVGHQNPDRLRPPVSTSQYIWRLRTHFFRIVPAAMAHANGRRISLGFFSESSCPAAPDWGICFAMMVTRARTASSPHSLLPAWLSCGFYAKSIAAFPDRCSDRSRVAKLALPKLDCAGSRA